MKYLVKVVVFILLSVSVTGCSNQMVYNLIQSSQRNECYLLPAGQHEDCLNKYRLSYTEYLSARKVYSDLNSE